MARDDLFAEPQQKAAEPAPPHHQPLAARMRPRTLAEFVGQTHILGPGQLLRRAIEADRIQSLIFFGPPGTGKTSLAQIIAHQTRSRFERLSGVESNVADMRRVLAAAANRLENTGRPTILFVDEIHRFNKAQQDVLLPDVESGVIRLIGATTHNPFFFVNSPLVSRSQIFELRPLSEEELRQLLQRALEDPERGLGHLKIRADADAIAHLAKLSDGDARKALNSLEIAALTTEPGPDGVIHITLAVAEQSIQKKAVVYDDEDAHYDTISAFIKSMRGSDPDAALYWLAKMIHAGEDPRFIARRIVICAAEDVGLADPMALVLANAALSAAEFVGWPEARIPLAEATIYIATAHKSNSAYLAIDAALEDVRAGRTLPVPEHLRDASYRGAKRLGHGQGYEYAHSHPEHFVAQDYLGADKRYYEPTEQGVEKKIKERVEKWRARFEQVRKKA
ncbi:MAG TPA: replication-associated recombination protein A [Verrucomicrobia bacterium]|nr:replication-associated recombination protein A [Verrucomicrobiota bacterium]HOB31921.1 replication-associated recombination protein A [Verrucomicrobiota bacterium]HOP97348.1 replication-associated recombination protein A [Verrucomicrobiota bacterium]